MVSPPQNGCNSLFTSHLPLARKMAIVLSRRLPSNITFDDLLGSAYEGLWQASLRFDKARGIAFSTFASSRVQGAMQDWLRANDRIPRTLRRDGLFDDRDFLSLDYKLGDEDGGSITLADLLPDKGPSPFDRVADGDEALALLHRLPARTQHMLLWHHHGVQLKTLGAIFHVSESRASQIVTRARREIQAYVATRSTRAPLPEPPEVPMVDHSYIPAPTTTDRHKRHADQHLINECILHLRLRGIYRQQCPKCLRIYKSAIAFNEHACPGHYTHP